MKTRKGNRCTTTTDRNHFAPRTEDKKKKARTKASYQITKKCTVTSDINHSVHQGLLTPRTTN